jgi:hypothetical protein
MANPRGAGLSDQAIAPGHRARLQKGKPVAVALAINSPGGSPAQSSLIAARIRRLAEEKKVPGSRLRRGCRGVGRLLAGLRGGQDLGRSDLDPGLHRRDLGRFRLSRGDREDRRGAARAHGRRVQIHPRPVPPRKGGGCRTAQGASGELHETFIDHVKTSRGGPSAGSSRAFHRRLLDRGQIGRAGPGRRHRPSRAQDEGAFRRQDPVRGLWPEAQPFRSLRPVAGLRTGHGAGGARGLRAVRPVVMLKIVTLFLVFMAVLAMFGRLRLPKITRRRAACPNHACARPAGVTTCAAGPARIAPKGRAEAWRQSSLWRGSASSSCSWPAMCS